MRSRDGAAGGAVTRALAGKEWRELVSSRAMWLLALGVGPLVGQGCITAVRTYAEMSAGSGGSAGALAEGLSPLDGFVVPTFGAYALIATLLLPFVAIRLVSEEKTSGALALLVQGGASLWRQVAVKFGVLLLAWLLTWIPGLVALALWRSYGGHLGVAETASVLLGHLLHGALIIAIALAAAALADNASSAAVITLAITLGGWALDFIGGVQGGVAARAARFTPESMLRLFEQGEIEWRILVLLVVLVLLLCALAVIVLRRGRSLRAQWRSIAAWLLIGVVAVASATLLHGSADVSEDQRHSLPPADARALSALRGTLVVEMHLGAQDPRRVDLERGVLHKLSRVMDVRVVPMAETSTGLFEGGYGEVWYVWNGRRAMSRSTTLPIILDMIYSLTGASVPTADPVASYPGHPLATTPRGAAVLFYLVWPVGIAVCWLLSRRRPA